MDRGPDDDVGTVDPDAVEAAAVKLAAAQAAEAEAGRLEAARATLARWTVGAAAERLLTRLWPPGGAATAYAWPGCEAGWPVDDGDRQSYPPAALVPAGEVTRADWRDLWRSIGPLAPDRLVVLVGMPARGKTAFAVQAAEAAAAAGAPVLYVSAELGPDELLARLLALRAPLRVPWSDILHGRVPEDGVRAAAEAAAGDLAGLYLWAPSGSSRTASALEEMARAVALVHGGPPLVVVDYLQRWGVGSAGDRRTEVSDLSSALRELCRPTATGWLGAGLLALSSTPRNGYGSFTTAAELLAAWTKAPDDLLGSGKETGDIEYDATTVLCLTSTPPAEGVRERDGLVVPAKVRERQGRPAGFQFDAGRGWWTCDGRVVARLADQNRRQAGADTTAGKGVKPPRRSPYGD